MKKSYLKKAGSMALCGVMGAALLAGCGFSAGSSDTGSASASSAAATENTKTTEGQTQNFKGVSLVYWSSWEATEPQGIVIADMVKEFEKETGCTVDLQFKGRSGIREGLIPALDAGQQVDLFESNSNKANYGDRIMCLEDLVSEHDYEKDTNPVLMKLCRGYASDGKLYEIPYQMRANLWLYNKDLFDKAGVTEVPQTWDEFLNVCQKLKDAGITPITTDDAYSMQPFGIHLARLMGGDNSQAVAQNGNWDDPKVLETAQAYEDLASKGYISSKVSANTWPTGQNTEFAAGQAAMYFGGTYIVNETKTITGDNFRWGMFNYPTLEDGVNGEEAMVIGCQSYAIPANCVNPEAAFALIEKITRGEWDAKLAKESLALPADINNSSWPEQFADVKPYMDNCTTIFKVSGGLETNSDITPALKENLLKLYSGSITAEEFTANMKAAAAQ
ncbi:MAG: ABC transporter substrate-binding protein [Lachnospiraceae bacterium]|nr:ABC transporter substrate-binding protein [Lachnospiraceae bacterium]